MKKKTDMNFEEKRIVAQKFICKLCPSLHETVAMTHILDSHFSSQLNSHLQLNVMAERNMFKKIQPTMKKGK